MTDVPEKLGTYRIVRKVGSGGMADVYEAFDEQLKRQVALKVISPKFAENEEASSRFEREILATAKLRHPNIVTIYGVGHEEGLTFYTMELLPGGDLKAKINAGISLKEVISIARQISKALAYAHKQGLVHRDLKPENIIFNEDGYAVLTDLGIAKVMGKDETMAGTVLGTAYYMSPEQAMAEQIDGRSDLYSLGVVIYRMLTSKHLFDADSTWGICSKHIQQPPPPLPDEHSDFQPLLDKLLAKSPDDRYQSGDEVISALNALERKLSSKIFDKDDTAVLNHKTAKRLHGTNSGKITPPAATNKMMPMIGIAVLVVLAVAASWFYFAQPGPPELPIAGADEPEVIDPSSGEPGKAAPGKSEPSKEEPVKPVPTEGDAILYLSGQPEGAEVFFNQKSLGITPLTLENLPAGEQLITVQKHYYQPQVLKVNLLDDALVKAEYKLAKGQGTLTIISSPEKASVYLNGKLHPSKTPLSIEQLQAGEYRFKVQKEDGVFEGQFQLSHDQKLVLRPTLTKGNLIAYKGSWFSPEDLMALAAKDMKAKNAFLPAGDNALLKYRAILSATDSKHKEAQEKLDEILTIISASFQQFNKDKNFETASKLLTYIKQEIPEFKDAAKVEENLKTAIAKAESAKKEQAYQQQVATVNKLIDGRQFKLAETQLKTLAANFPEGKDTPKLVEALKQAKQDYYDKVTRYSGVFSDVPEGSISLDNGQKITVKAFAMGEKEVTFAQWDTCVQDNACSHQPEDSNWGRANRPVINISLEDISSQFIPWLNRKTGESYRLPTEAEWERSVNTSSPFYWGEIPIAGYANGSQAFGWPSDGFKNSTAPVGSFKANGMGLFDLHGNVMEWTASCWAEQQSEFAQADGTAGNCNRFVTKGGSWKSGSKFLQTKSRIQASRFSRSNEMGFRLVRD